MKVTLSKGRFWVNGKEVSMLIFEDNSVMKFPIEEDNKLVLDSTQAINTSDIKGDKNVVIQGKNIVTGSVIHAGGNFILGDNNTY